MRHVRLLPHRTAPQDAWERADWLVSVDDGPLSPVRGVVNGWDYNSTLQFRSSTSIKMDRVHESCRTEPPTTYELLCIWDCPATGTRQAGSRALLSGSHTIRITTAFEVPPRTVAQRIRVERQLVLREPRNIGDPFSPKEPGMVVLGEEGDQIFSAALEGDGGRFPVEAIDFASQGLGGAVWWLSVEYESVHESFLSAVRLYVNSSHPAVQELLNEPDSSGSVQLLSVIQWDASRQLLQEVARQGEMEPGPYVEGSVGDVVIRLCRLILQEDQAAVMAMVENDPGSFERLIQDRMGLFRDD